VAELNDPELALSFSSARRAWTATGTDVFEALMNLRLDLEAEGVRLCCNGARRNAWASGMQRDMGRGRFVHLLEKGTTGRPPQVRTLDAAPCGEIVTVQEQKDFHADWLAQRRSHNA
jgi:hypothetical protein